MRKGRGFLIVLALVASRPLAAGLPPVPVPAENPITEPKRVLGKILFWDEQLSSDGSVACGTCHRPSAGGGDPRAGRHPGIDKGTIDDVMGSPGIVSLGRDGHARPHPLFGTAPQVTPRLSPSNFAGIWADELFWDGRARSELKDPLTGKVAIARGGALENQALAALLNESEMAKVGRSWADVAADLNRAQPLALATDLPPDTAAAIKSHPSYAALFEAAFGDSAITPLRIAFALATYQRTLVADQTPYDRFADGDTTALSGRALHGWKALQAFHCTACHTPPLFTNNEFFQIGLRRADFDRGREDVTGNPEDAGEMKVPSLRNAALKRRFMHTGEFTSLAAAIRFYINTLPLPERDGIPGTGLYTFNMSNVDENDLHEFIATALTDPRVRDETFPFDRPVLRGEHPTGGASGVP
ncbi:MAG TPA: cytochrome c peroxidase [Gammaproteobacteria bacterium]|nr:cytochrome c peroxidase [Gammaproteobacteria bacterium]